MRRTKILTTLGPATDGYDAIKNLISSGVDVVRVNFSHGSPEEHAQRVKWVLDAADELNTKVAILGDLQGPKIRTAKFSEGSIDLEVGAEFTLDADLDENAGNQHSVGITYRKLTTDCKAGDVLLLDDGRVVLEIIRIEGPRIVTKIISGAKLSNNKGINLQGGGLSAPALTEKDKVDIKLAAKLNVDYLAVSFPVKADDMNLARQLLKEAGGEAGLVAKIERAEAIEKDTLDGIILASDAIMVARGDLGVEIGDAELPAAQKYMIDRARELNRVTITATQMMESMIENLIPTRAEVFDVANAVIDGTDAVMLSGETAVGRHPSTVVRAMSEICESAEKHDSVTISTHRIDSSFDKIDEAIAMATMYTANHYKVSAIIALTESGSTTHWMSRIRSSIPIFAMSTHEETLRRVKLYRGVFPVKFDTTNLTQDDVNLKAVEKLISLGYVDAEDTVIVTKGDALGDGGGTNRMKIVRVKDLLKK